MTLLNLNTFISKSTLVKASFMFVTTFLDIYENSFLRDHKEV